MTIAKYIRLSSADEAARFGEKEERVTASSISEGSWTAISQQARSLPGGGCWSFRMTEKAAQTSTGPASRRCWHTPDRVRLIASSSKTSPDWAAIIWTLTTSWGWSFPFADPVYLAQ